MRYVTIDDKNPLILASRSPRRKQLLQQLRIPYEVRPSNIKEQREEDDPMSLACRLASHKAFNVLKSGENRWILGADTIIEIGGHILGKPSDEAHAFQMLQRLNGRTHCVHTGFAIIEPGGSLVICEVVSTHVKIKQLSSEEIMGYIRTGEPFGKAGSYAIQGIGAFLVESISGCYTNVVGLPLCALVKALIRVRALKDFPIISSGP